MSFLSDLLTGGAGSIIKSAGEVIGEFVTTDKERMAAQLEQDALGLKREEAYLADTDSARKMQIAALQQDDLFSKRFIYWFAAGWSIFSMAFFVAVTFAPVPKDNLRFVDTLLGFLLGTAIASIFNFFLGTSMSSKAKDSTISALAKDTSK